MRLTDLMILLPIRPRTVSVRGGLGQQVDGVLGAGVRPVAGGADAVITDRAGDAGGGVTLVVGAPAIRRWGHSEARYRVWSSRGDGEGMVVTAGGHRLPPSRLLRRGARPGPQLRVLAAGTTTPAVVAAAAPGARLRRLGAGDDPRRRVALIVDGPDRHERRVVKASWAPGAGSRAEIEQAHLHRLHALGLGSLLPVPLGHGDLDGLAWSVESLVPGVAMADAGRLWRGRHGRPALDGLAAWLTQLAVATTSQGGISTPIDRGIRGRRSQEGGPDLLAAVAHLPAVTTHGDLASGLNVLVSRSAPWIIDWETATEGGLPLLDLLPTLALAMARLRGHRGPSAQAGYVLSLCRGQEPDSPWLFDHVLRYVGALAIGPAEAGALAALSWEHQAGMREVHDDLVRAAGHEPIAWISAAELVADGWSADPLLGDRWGALVSPAAGAL